MITLLTGLPGNGKTLYALWYIKAKAAAENREVYYHNIKDLQLPWSLLDKPEEWMNCPAGSIIVLDEAQFVFPKKPNGSKLPEHYEKLAVHRHSGFDIYVITQHPSLLDNFVRQLVGQHFHAVRKFGMNRATIYEWSAVNPAPQNPSSQKSAIALKWAYPKEVFSYYKSAEVHTVKRAIPAKIYLALGFVVFVGFAGWWAMDRYKSRYEKPGDPQPQVAASAGPGAVNVVDTANTVPNNTNSPPFDRVADAQDYVDKNTPRVVGLVHTAPKYDPLTDPVRVPVPAACIQIGTAASNSAAPRCKCYSQQGTPMDVEYNMCISFARNGWFRDFDADPDRGGESRQQRVVSAPQASVAASRPEDDTLPPLVPQGSFVVSMSAPSGASEQRPSLPQDAAPPNRRSIPARTVYAPQPST